MSTKTKNIIVFSALFLFIFSVLYLPSIIIKYKYNNLSKLRVESIIAEDCFIDWVPAFSKWRLVSGYMIENMDEIYEKEVNLGDEVYKVLINSALLNNKYILFDIDEDTRPAIFGTVVKFEGTDLYGVKNLDVKILTKEDAEN